MAIFMEYEGIKGDVTAKGYKGMIQLRYIKFGVSHKISMVPGDINNLVKGLPSFNIFKMWKYFDSASNPIFEEMISASKGKQVHIHVLKTGHDGLEPILTYTLENCLPTHYNILITDRDGCIPPERLFLSYTAIKINQGAYDASNKKVIKMCSGYDLTTAKKL